MFSKYTVFQTLYPYVYGLITPTELNISKYPTTAHKHFSFWLYKDVTIDGRRV
jgi:hypothetical protein